MFYNVKIRLYNDKISQGKNNKDCYDYYVKNFFI